MMSIVGALSLAINVATNRFIYPNSSTMPDFNAGDRVNVTWISSFTQPSLQLNCDHFVLRKLPIRAFLLLVGLLTFGQL